MVFVVSVVSVRNVHKHGETGILHLRNGKRLVLLRTLHSTLLELQGIEHRSEITTLRLDLLRKIIRSHLDVAVHVHICKVRPRQIVELAVDNIGERTDRAVSRCSERYASTYKDYCKHLSGRDETLSWGIFPRLRRKMWRER